jgi:hypothetical protein
MILDLLPLPLGILIGFACGYGVRELMSRRRRDAIRRKYYHDHPEERRDDL